jgi:glycosyltransferase involved in cell wall biosynthesis
MAKLKICHVTLHGCIRAAKMAMSQQLAGHTVHFATGNMVQAHSYDGYAAVHVWSPYGRNEGEFSDAQLGSTIRSIDKNIDLYHVHNEPNWIFRTVKANTDKPIVFDIHDWTSIGSDRQKTDIEEEEYALDNANAFIVPSRGYLKKIRERSKRPSMLVYSKVPSFIYPPAPSAKNPGLAYEGGVKGKTDLEYNFAYRNWAQFAKEAVKYFPNGDKIFFYTANSGEDFGDYADPKILMHEPMIYPQMIAQCSTHTAGLVGSPYPLKDFEDSMPNKLFEYVAAGIPCIVVNAPEAKEFVETHGLGIGIQDPKEVADALLKLKDHTVLRDRWDFTMETEIPKLITFYEDLLGRSVRPIPQMGVHHVQAAEGLQA